MGFAPTAVVEQGNEGIQQFMVGRDTRWYKGNLLKLNILVFFVLITSMTVGYDSSMMNGLQTLDTWKTYFNNPQGGTLGLFNAIQSIGGLAGLPISPYISDRFGRRIAIIIGCVIMLLGAGLQTGSRNVGMFIAARFIVGFGVAIASLSAPMLTTELAFPSHRAPLTALYNTSWLLGSIVAAWSTYGTFRITSTWSWRIPSLLQGLPSVVQLMVIYFIPESPRWLIDHKNPDLARAFIAKYHCEGNGDDPLVDYEMYEMTEAIRLEKEAKQNSTYKSLFTDRANLRRMRIIIPLAFFSQWSGNGLVSYYLVLILNGIGITKVKDQTLINGILNLWNYGLAIVSSLVVDRFGRRKMFLTSVGGMCLAFSVWTACSAVYAESNPLNPNHSAGYSVLAFIFIYYGFYVVAMTPLVISYPVEILPYSVRAKGMTVLTLGVNASVIFNQYVNPIALAKIGWKYYLVYCIWLAVEFVYLYIFVVETKGKNGPLPLEEIANLFADPNDRAVIVPTAADLGIRDESAMDTKAEVQENELAQANSLDKV